MTKFKWFVSDVRFKKNGFVPFHLSEQLLPPVVKSKCTKKKVNGKNAERKPLIIFYVILLSGGREKKLLLVGFDSFKS